MIVILYRQAKGACQVLGRAEKDEFVNQLITAAQLMENSASTGLPLRQEGSGGQIVMGEDIIEVDPKDVAIEINFDPEASVTDVLGAEPTDAQIRIASVTLDEMGRFHLRQRLLLQTQQAQHQQAQVEETQKGIRLVKNLKERDLQ